ncbi:MAG: motility protein A [Bdellovibrionales bacterium]
MPIDSQSTPDDESIANAIPIDIPRTRGHVDLITVIGLLTAIGLVVAAAILGDNKANFFNIPAVFIVVFGTIAVTAVSYTAVELNDIRRSISAVFVRKSFKHKAMAEQLVNLSVRAKKYGPLSLTKVEPELRRDPYLLNAMQMVSDGVNADMIETILDQASETGHERKLFAASALRKAGEVAPGMGLIGTLVGLVKMLAQLDDPASIGPAMAIALLTTFYGALLGTVILTPLATKLERSVEAEAMMQDLIRTAAVSMARQESPRQLEVLLNSLLPARHRIQYF